MTCSEKSTTTPFTIQVSLQLDAEKDQIPLVQHVTIGLTLPGAEPTWIPPPGSDEPEPKEAVARVHQQMLAASPDMAWGMAFEILKLVRDGNAVAAIKQFALDFVDEEDAQEKDAACLEVAFEVTTFVRERLAPALLAALPRLKFAMLETRSNPPGLSAGEIPFKPSVEEWMSVYEQGRGMLIADALLAQELRRLGPTGTKACGRLRKKAKERLAQAREGQLQPGRLWKIWLPEQEGQWPTFLAIAADALWHDRVKARRQRARRNPPALVVQVHEDVSRIHSRAHKYEKRNDGQGALAFEDRDPIVVTPTIDDEAVRALVERGAGLLGSITAHRALRWEVVEGHTRALRGEPDARALKIDGGWSTFAHDVLRLSKKSDAENLRAIVHAQAAVMLRLPNGSTGNMLALRETPQRGRRRGSIEIVLGTMLLPHYVYALNELSGRGESEAKRLVPVVAELPPLIGRANDHGPQAALSMLVVRELRMRARELVNEGGAAIPLERFAELARQAALPVKLLGPVLARWTRDGDDRFLEEVAKGRYTLGQTHAQARAFLEAAGHQELAGSEAGKRSVAAREAKRRRLTRGRP